MNLQPFVKWAGGKRQIMDKLLEFKPKKFRHYFEPFVGGGALLMELAPIHATINDSNKELMYIYKCLRNKRLFKKFYELCKEHEANHSEEYYYKIRDLDKKKNAYAKLPTPNSVVIFMQQRFHFGPHLGGIRIFAYTEPGSVVADAAEVPFPLCSPGSRYVGHDVVGHDVVGHEESPVKIGKDAFDGPVRFIHIDRAADETPFILG